MKNYKCQKHDKIFYKFCEDCHSNICSLCDNDHQKHKTISLSNLNSNIEQSKIRLDEIKLEIDILSKEIKK